MSSAGWAVLRILSAVFLLGVAVGLLVFTLAHGNGAHVPTTPPGTAPTTEEPLYRA